MHENSRNHTVQSDQTSGCDHGTLLAARTYQTSSFGRMRLIKVATVALAGASCYVGILLIYTVLTHTNGSSLQPRSQQDTNHVIRHVEGFAQAGSENAPMNGSDIIRNDRNRKSTYDDARAHAQKEENVTFSIKPALIDIDQAKLTTDALYRQLVVVTAFSQNHYKEALGMIGSAQQTMPNTRIVVYDLGIQESYKDKVRALCNVELRPFQFNKYPAFVKKVLTFSWKIIIIKEAVNEFGVVFWADASVRFRQPLKALLPFAQDHHGYLSRIHSYKADTKSPIKHNFYYTHELMYKWLGVDKEKYAKSSYAPHVAANRQLVINSSTVQQNFLRPLYACAMDKNCIVPPGSKHGRHRYDASALMLVIHKYFPGEFSRENDHLKDLDEVIYMHRKSNDWETARNC
ncbi:uncharacterized protein LOC119730871 [Patiria miniata]|uniref:Uncharacterized protein n=1 Tax=Patiria miniata TaxID=46514 RepID=A0A914A7M6_PATMI|nr:uncharacterized protein LOC119730871 [Patiria miniata]